MIEEPKQKEKTDWKLWIMILIYIVILLIALYVFNIQDYWFKGWF